MPNLLIFGVIEPRDSYEKIKEERKNNPGILGLVRESRKAGCLTVDFWDEKNKKCASLRLALVQLRYTEPSKWIELNDDRDYDRFLCAGRITETYLGSFDDNKRSVAFASFCELLEKKGFNETTLMQPTEKQQSKNPLYNSYTKDHYLNQKQDKKAAELPTDVNTQIPAAALSVPPILVFSPLEQEPKQDSSDPELPKEINGEVSSMRTPSTP